jgi:hypothetical protein
MTDGAVEKQLVRLLFVNGWVLFAAMTTAAWFHLPHAAAAGATVGALLVAVNLTLLKRAVYRILAAGRDVRPRQVLTKFYLCFAATAGIVSVLIITHLVNGLGLLLGLSIFFLDVMMVVSGYAGRIVYRFITKEAT